MVLVIEDEDKPGVLRGYALVLWHGHGRVARLYSLAVDPAARGRGIGGRLLDACAEHARVRSFKEFRLEVAEANEPALALYRRAGFELFGRRRAYYADGSDALRLRLWL
jgi:ribosomal protein S18 acetylase RimI-like enzyme